MSAYSVPSGERQWPALLPMTIAAALTAYTAIRYGYRWAETDTAAFVRAIRAIQDARTLTPEGAYPNGFGYQSIVITVMELTGLSMATLQLAILPFLSVIVALCAFLAMRALTGNAIIGGLASLLLFIQPEFLFVIQRGNHEKVTHIFLLSIVYLLVTSVIREHRLANMAALVVAYYVTVWALIVTNSFFASSFLVGLGLAVFGGVIALRLFRTAASEHHPAWRLRYTALATFILLFVFINYVYTPAQHGVALYQVMFEQVSEFLFGEEPSGGSPYTTIEASWVARWVYPILTSFSLAIVASAGLTWIWLARRFRRHSIPSQDRHLLILWLLTAAFALQVLISILVDYSGFLEANLQIRFLPVFMLFGIPLAVIGAVMAFQSSGAKVQRLAVVLAPSVVAFFAIVGVLKATNDPLVSNKWLFFSESEKQALIWVDSSVRGREVWTDIDERLRTMQDIHQPADPDQGNVFLTGDDQVAPYALSTDLTRGRMLRMGIPLPDSRQDDRIYDNGGAQVYHRVPETPYQP